MTASNFKDTDYHEQCSKEYANKYEAHCSLQSFVSESIDKRRAEGICLHLFSSPLAYLSRRRKEDACLKA